MLDNFFAIPRKKKSKSEQLLQEFAAKYFGGVLLPGVAKYEGHEASLGLGIMRPEPKDTYIEAQCKKFYNNFIIPAQRKLQAKGVTKGSSDGFLFHRAGVICLEFKIGKNKAQDAQEHFAKEMLAIGHPTEYPRTPEDVMAIPRKYNIKTRETE